MTKELLMSCIAFALFVVCPRMAGMMHIINSNSQVSMVKTVLIGALLSIPILFLMVFIFNKFGVMGALTVCVLTDLCAALIMNNISLKAGIETFVIAIFVIVGVKVAPFISKIFVK